MDLRDAINATEAAKLVGVTGRTLRNWSREKKEGKPLAELVAGRWLFNREEVIAYAEKKGPALSTNPNAVRRRRFYAKHKR